MNENTKTILSIFAQFLNGQITGDQFADSLTSELERGEKQLNTLQINLKAQADVIDEYVKNTNKNIIEIDELKNMLSKMVKNRDYWKEEYIKLFSADMNLLTAIQVVHKGKTGKLNVIDHGNYATWDPSNDKEYQSYVRARRSIAEYKVLEKLLLFIKHI